MPPGEWKWWHYRWIAAAPLRSSERSPGWDLAIRTDQTRAAAEKLDAAALPVTLLIDRQGRELARFVGAADWSGPPATPLLEALASDRPLTPDLAPPQLRPPLAP